MVDAKATDGVSILPTLLGRAGEQRRPDFLYFEYPEKGGQLAVRMGRWKGVKLDMKANPNAAWQLFDSDADARETTDVASGHPDVLRQLDGIVKREHRRAHIQEWEFLDNRLPRRAPANAGPAPPPARRSPCAHHSPAAPVRGLLRRRGRPGGVARSIRGVTACSGDDPGAPGSSAFHVHDSGLLRIRQLRRLPQPAQRPVGRRRLDRRALAIDDDGAERTGSVVAGEGQCGGGAHARIAKRHRGEVRHVPRADGAHAGAGGRQCGLPVRPGFLDPSHPLHAAAADGVSCTLCHQVQSAGLGTPASFTGGTALTRPRTRRIDWPSAPSLHRSPR